MDHEETNDDTPTKTSETVELYERLYERLKTATREEVKAHGQPLPDSEEPSPYAIVVTFREREATWSKSTAKLYRVALSHCLKNMWTPDAYEARRILMRTHIQDIHDDEERAREIEAAKKHDAEVVRIRREREISIAAGSEKPRTSGQKAKMLKAADLQTLIMTLGDSGSSFAKGAMLWIMAGYLTGLRPAEWATAQIALDDKQRRILVIFNAKATNGRSFGINRRLLLTRLSPTEFDAVEQHMVRARSAHESGKFNDYYNGCRGLLHAINTRLWPKRKTHPTLYTARHMFASDAKSVFSKVEVAALMGHASDKTAGLHYGKRRHAKGGVKVEPSEADVASVAKINPNSGPNTFFGNDGDAGKSDQNNKGGTYR